MRNDSATPAHRLNPRQESPLLALLLVAIAAVLLVMVS
jgi:hypothetical protein